MMERITVPALPVEIPEVRSFLRLDDETEDVLLETLVLAAQHEAESRTGRKLGRAEWRVVFPDGSLLSDWTEVPVVPCVEVVSASFRDGDGEELPADVFDMELSSTIGGEPARLRVSPLGAGDAASIDGWSLELIVEGGYDECPAPIRAWILQRVATLYEQRTAVSTGTNIRYLGHDFADALLDPFVLHGGF